MPRRRAAPPARTRRSAAPRRASTPRAPPIRRPSLSEAPHGHIVCRSCGRIHPLELQAADLGVLIDLTARGPSGWAVERVAYSIAAVCPNCQRAASTA